MRKKKIALDLRWIRGGKLDGIGRYAVGLISELVRRGRHKYEFVILYNDAWQERFLLRGKYAKKLKLSFPVLSLREPFLLPRILRAKGISLFWSPYFLTYPFFKGLKTVLTVHDLIPFKFSGLGSLPRRIFFASKVPVAHILRKADLLICGSWATKNDLKDLFGLEPTIIHGGITERFWGTASAQEKARVRKKYHLPPRFVLCLSRFDPYKNLSTLLGAYQLLPGKLKEAYPLVVAGKQDERQFPLLLEQVRTINLEKCVLFPGYIEDKDLYILYQLASLFVYPSLAEGFGFPPLEAMASGTPVVCFKIPSLEEVVGDGAILVSDVQKEKLSSAMERLLTDKDLANFLSQRGKETARRFSWKRAGRQLIRLFDKLLSG